MAWARARRIPVVSAIDAHRPQEPSNGKPRHCIDGSQGQQKLRCTLLDNRTTLEADNSFAVPINVFKKHRQVVLHKRTTDLLCNPKADRLLSESRVAEYVVFGIGAEDGIKAVVLGLLARQKRVSVIADACGYWDRSAAAMAFRQMEAKGARIIHTQDLRNLPRPRYPTSRWLARRAIPSTADGNGRRHLQPPVAQQEGTA